MPSVTDICNLALAHLGEQEITSLEENSEAARACARCYEAARDAMLRSHRWNFAATRVKLAPLAEKPAFDWTFQFQLPVDCLRVLEVNGTAYGDQLNESYPLEGRRILSDVGSLKLIYVRQVTNATEFDALFVKALAVQLAIDLSEIVRGTTSKTAELQNLLTGILAPMAKRVDANEGARERGNNFYLNSGAIAARFGWYGGWAGNSYGSPAP